MTTTEIAKSLRSHLRKQQIKARCRVTPGMHNSVQVFVTHPDGRFSDDEQRAIRTLAIKHGLTRVRGIAINPERMTDPHEMTFYLS